MNKLLFKAILSTLLFLSLLLLAVTGFAMHFNTTGLVLGLPRHVVRSLHTAGAVFMCVGVLLHLILNLKTLFAEWRQGRRRKK
ncbi:MAG: DUF4405 domain-containing protein [Firmicutes bacterium]|nr:DUF4405 domain-containing protein [Bacillota bacterium]